MTKLHNQAKIIILGGGSQSAELARALRESVSTIDVTVGLELLGGEESLDILDQGHGLFHELDYQFHDCGFDLRLVCEPPLEPAPFHHQLNQPARRPFREGKQVQTNRRSLHRKQK